MNTKLTKQQEKYSKSNSILVYKDLVCSGGNILDFFYYEFVTSLFSFIPGLIGLLSRLFSFKFLFKKSNAKSYGKSMIIRGGKRITINKGVILDDFSVLDARGESALIDIDNNVFIGRGSAIVAKDAQIKLHQGVNISSDCRIASQSKVEIGESTLIGAYCYIGPGNHTLGKVGESIISNEMDIKDGVSIGKNSWLGARVTVLDGVKIGEGVVIGAHSLVTTDIADNCIAAGVPAKVIKKRV